jgi:hypothetical protein
MLLDMKEHFSERETEIIKIIGTRTLNLEQIADKVFEDSYQKPFDANISVANSIRRIIQKCEYHKLKWTLVKGKKNRKMVVRKEDT